MRRLIGGLEMIPLTFDLFSKYVHIADELSLRRHVHSVADIDNYSPLHPFMRLLQEPTSVSSFL